MSKDCPIAVENLTKYYKYGVRGILVQALDRVSFTLEDNEVLGIIGANGAGKSTTIKILIGAVKQSSGECKIFGKELSKKVRRDIGYLPEAPYFYKFLTGFELVTFYAKLSGMSTTEAKNSAMRALNLVGLDDAADRAIGLYSKGMVQRAGLAQAIVHNPKLVILDEPASGLDPMGSADMAEIIKRLKADGKSILLCSHIMSEVETLCDRVVVLSKGKVAACGSVDELLTKTNSTEMIFNTTDNLKLDAIEANAKLLGAEVVQRKPARISLAEFFKSKILK
ncbi:MAG: ABC transporter ATP-binding protein [Verrucomicrobiaceae bacterium]|nr:ABC transporter ATP-binding protein [Verrucomicrobiaceae bacterium]